MKGLSVGDVVADRYEVDSFVGSGGMGHVWRARDRTLDRTVALKSIRPEFWAGSADASRIFDSEARNTARLNHENIVQIYDYLKDDGQPILVLEYMRGSTLHELIYSRDWPRDTFTMKTLSYGCCMPLVRALSHAHREGVVHRDVAPQNVLVSTRSGIAKLSDFGLARATLGPARSFTTRGFGRFAYMAPEQFSEADTSESTDVYQLGCSMFEILEGGPPYDGTPANIMNGHVTRPVPELSKWVDVEFAAVVRQCLAKDPNERPDLQEVWSKLRDLVLVEPHIEIGPLGDDDRESLSNCGLSPEGVKKTAAGSVKFRVLDSGLALRRAFLLTAIGIDRFKLLPRGS